ncbi:MAG: hypothetical protein RLZ06_248, partial [Actinomycetota bacterium]
AEIEISIFTSTPGRLAFEAMPVM